MLVQEWRLFAGLMSLQN